MKHQDCHCSRAGASGLWTALWLAGSLIAACRPAQGAVVEAWVQRHDSGVGDASDYALKIVRDGAGDIIVAGDTDNGLTGTDMLVIKYSGATGAVIWQRRYNGPGNGTDHPGGLAVDGSGNVVVIGVSVGNGSFGDYYTAKYAAADGALIWERHYNGPGNYNDWGEAVAVDHDGNVVVTGRSAVADGYDYYTAKYAAADGALLWEKGYNGPSNLDDGATGIAVDRQGNVIVTGSSANAHNAEYDYCTIKYAAADGALLWQRRYNGPESKNDAARAVAVDRNDDVVVTGLSYSGYFPDYYTAKYAAADGALLWEKRYDGPIHTYDAANALAVDINGNVVVTGQSFGGARSFSYYTAKYASANGALLWEQRYNGLATNGGVAQAVTVDGFGNVAVTGYSEGSGGRPDYYTAKYAAADGALLWEKRFDGPANQSDAAYAIVADGNGDVIVTGASQASGGLSDFYTAKYAAADGALLWEQRHNGLANHYDAANAVAMDGAGNVVVTGASQGAGGGLDYYTIKYAAAGGGLLWAHRYNGPNNDTDVANAVALDGSGNVVVTGYSVGLEGSVGLYTAKYVAGDGRLLWEKRYEGPDNSHDEGSVVAVDARGDVIVAGKSYSRANGDEAEPDFYTAKYAGADGTLLWERRYDAAAGGDTVTGMKLDSHNNVVVTGFSVGREGTGDFYTAKYAAGDGALLWEHRYNGSDYGSDSANAVAVDANDNVIVTGSSQSAPPNVHYDFYTAKYAAADGARLWEVRYNGPGDFDNEGRSVAVDQGGNVIVTGYSYGAGGRQEIYTAKYGAASGTLLWEQRYHGQTNFGENVGNAVAVDDAGNVVVSGYASNGANNDYYTAKYAASNGALLWERRYNGPGPGIDYPAFRGLAVGPGGRIAVTGYSDHDYATIVYQESQPPMIICPTNIVADFSSDDGGVIRFSVTALDNSGAPPAITCVPPSGSAFPIGQTTVRCTATDGDGVSSRCTFTVAIRGARGVKGSVLAELVSLRDTTTNREIGRKLDRAIEPLTSTLAAEFWLDETHLEPARGENVFREDEKTLDILWAIIGAAKKKDLPGAVLQGSIDRILKADRLLASVAIREAIQDGVSEQKINQARKSLARGDAAAGDGHGGNSLEDYRQAWKIAVGQDRH